MGIPVMVLGESGRGKSASLRNFDPRQIGIINVAGKPLPFKATGFNLFHSDNYAVITGVLKNCKARSVVIDDAQYLMANAFMRQADVKGYDKFTQMASDYWNLVQTVVNDLPDDKIVYFLQHIAVDDQGRERAKTIGRMLDEKITVEGMFSIVLKCVVQDGHYLFSTRNSGTDTVKTPIDMFSDALIDNDLSMVDKTIRDFYGLTALDAPEATRSKANEEKKVEVIKSEKV